MGSIAPRTVQACDATVEVRCAQASDAPGIIALNRHMAEWELSVIEPDESGRDPLVLAREIEHNVRDPQHLRLVALEGDLIVGALEFVAPSKRRIRHRGRFGIAIAADWRGRGIGTALIAAMIDWARAHAHIEKIRLGVLAENTRAIALYRRLGFVEEGRRSGEFKLRGGRYCDDVMMCVWVKPTTGGQAGSEGPVA